MKPPSYSQINTVFSWLYLLHVHVYIFYVKGKALPGELSCTQTGLVILLFAMILQCFRAFNVTVGKYAFLQLKKGQDSFPAWGWVGWTVKLGNFQCLS